MEWRWQLIKEPSKTNSLLESENVLNVPWIKVNNAAADIPASHESCAANKTVKTKYMNYDFLFTKLPSLKGCLKAYFSSVDAFIKHLGRVILHTNWRIHQCPAASPKHL